MIHIGYDGAHFKWLCIVITFSKCLNPERVKCFGISIKKHIHMLGH